MDKPTVTIATDGSCAPNPGRGGWGAIISYGVKFKEMCGYEEASTSNRMELMAVCCALEALTKPCIVKMLCDSQYVQQGITSWIKKWKLNGWLTAKGKDVVSKDLWLRLDAAAAKHEIEWMWVKGHDGHAMNEHAHTLAFKGREMETVA